MSGIGGNGNDFEGKPDDGSGAAGLRGCNSPVLDEGKRTGRYVSFDRYSPEQA